MIGHSRRLGARCLGDGDQASLNPKGNDMIKSETKANWQTIDTETLPAPIAKQYAHYKESYAEMKAERKAFEDAVTDLISPPKGKRIAFGYNFGKLSVALVDDDAKPASKSSIRLAELCRR